MKRGVIIASIISVIILILILVLIYLLFFSTKTCSDEQCWTSSMSSCTKASYISETDEASWQYVIISKQEECVINVKLLQAKTGSNELADLEGKDMDCSLALGYTGNPSADLARCSGKLKEGMQDIIIKNMHAYLLANFGKIAEELTKAV